MAKTVKTTFKLRRGTATEWLAANPNNQILPIEGSPFNPSN